MVRDRANVKIYENFQILIGNILYMSVNYDIKFELHIFPFDRIRAPNVHSYTGIPN